MKKHEGQGVAPDPMFLSEQCSILLTILLLSRNVLKKYSISNKIYNKNRPLSGGKNGIIYLYVFKNGTMILSQNEFFKT